MLLIYNTHISRGLNKMDHLALNSLTLITRSRKKQTSKFITNTYEIRNKSKQNRKSWLKTLINTVCYLCIFLECVFYFRRYSVISSIVFFAAKNKYDATSTWLFFYILHTYSAHYSEATSTVVVVVERHNNKFLK